MVALKTHAIGLLVATGLAAGLVPAADAQGVPAARDVTKQPTLYTVGYAHLDTQWRWSYPQVIREMIPNTMRDNFRLFEKYPDYVFNFSGANRYRMMKEYYPAAFDSVKRYVAAGRWFPCGSSMEECDVNVTGAESIIRQVLYGNHFFRRELGTASNEFMLPDCFGFPASLPTLLGHCGLKGFSTQKLTWGSAVGIPFHVGVWEGLDGTGLVSALDAGDYGGVLTHDLSTDTTWQRRLDGDGRRSGVYADYMYYGTGDEGGSPTEESVRWLEKSLAGAGPVRVLSTPADRMFLDIPASKVGDLPRYKGDLLLTEHSAGSITSAAMMKRWNRHNERMADAAERASVLADWLGGLAYPRERLNAAWTLVMGGQFHDILPGTSHPKAYEYSWNDELLALNQFAGVLESAVGSVAEALDTRAKGVPVVVYNPLSIEREDVVEATVELPDGAEFVRVIGPDGREVPSQVVLPSKGIAHILFLAPVPSVGFAVFDVQPAAAPYAGENPLEFATSASASRLENARYRVVIDQHGDIDSIFDKVAGRDLLSAPARLEFLFDHPRAWPAWNVDWADRQKPPIGCVDGAPSVRVVERGPVRLAVEIERTARGSRFVHTIRLSAGSAGDRVEFADLVDWQSSECSLKASFPLAVADTQATYSWEVGAIRRGNNNPKRYEVPSHQWFDLTDHDGSYGVTVLSDAKYGSDKPDDRTLRLTLLRTPGVGAAFQDQGVQDWGRHEIRYGLAGHAGDWRKGRTDWQALRMEQPLLTFTTMPHPGRLGHSFSLLRASSDRVRVMALKKAEDSDEAIVRLVELDGAPLDPVRIAMAKPIVAAREVDGQERPLGAAMVEHGALVTSLHGYQLRTFALRLGAPPARVQPVESHPVALPFDRCVASRDGQAVTDGMDAASHRFPAEMLPAEIVFGGVRFALGPDDGKSPNAVACAGQTITLPAGRYDRLYLLAASNGERPRSTRPGEKILEADLLDVGGRMELLHFQDWSGYIGQWDTRVWKGQVADYAFEWPYELLGLRPAYLRPSPVAWFSSHRHDATGANEPYRYSYLFAYSVELPPGTTMLTLPRDEHAFVFAATVRRELGLRAAAAQPLMDALRRDDITLVPTIYPADGRFRDVTQASVRRPLWAADARLRITLDGSDPTAASPEYGGPLSLYQPVELKARLFDGDRPVGSVAAARLEVNDVTPPAVEEAIAVAAIPQVVVRFSEPLDTVSAEDAKRYTVSGGVQVQSATLAADERTVTLALSAPPAEATVLSVRGVRDRAPVGNAAMGQSRDVRVLRPLFTAPDAALDGAGGGTRDLPLGDGAPTAGPAPWTLNVWLWLDQQPGDYTLVAGFGNARDRSGVQRYLAKFPEGLHFWGSSVDVETKVPLDLDCWQMLTAAFDGSTLKVFKDGKELASESIRLADAAAIARVGPPAPWSYGHQLAGKVAGFALWKEALPAPSVAALYERGLPAKGR
jgi:alpha-mannosidase